MKTDLFEIAKQMRNRLDVTGGKYVKDKKERIEYMTKKLWTGGKNILWNC